jgi:hypothetical protein
LTPLPWRLVYFFVGFSLISLGFGPNSGYWCRVFLTLRNTLVFVIGLLSF